MKEDRRESFSVFSPHLPHRKWHIVYLETKGSTMSNIAERRILVAGGSQGIGLAIAERLLEEGAQVVIASNEFLDQPGQTPTLPEGAQWVQVDLSTADGPVKMIHEAQDLLGNSVQTLFYVAGTYIPDGLESENVIDIWNLTYHLKVRGSYLAALEFVRQLDPETEDPNVIFVSSINAQRSEREHLAYDGACGAVEAQTRAFAVQFPHVRFNCLAPGLVHTGLTAPVLNDPRQHEHALRGIPMGRVGQTTDYAGPAVFLCSKDSAYMTGSVLLIDGGIGALQAPESPECNIAL